MACSDGEASVSDATPRVFLAGDPLQEEEKEISTWLCDLVHCGKALGGLSRIKCDDCGKWFHLECLDFDDECKERLEAADYWVCPTCPTPEEQKEEERRIRAVGKEQKAAVNVSYILYSEPFLCL